MKRLISGIKPSGELHLGNYLGAIKQFIELQNDYDCFFFIADYHALTSRPKADKLKDNTLHVAAMLLALGLDPNSSPIFLQSDIPEHVQLSWILCNFTNVGELMRMTQFKEKSDHFGQNAGLFTYPVLMSADILLYDTDVVPVGEDQLQHLELTREIARRFNNFYGHIFTEPKPLLNKTARTMALNNPKAKMSKSVAGSAIGLLDKEEEIEAVIKKAVTDSDPNSAHMSPALANLFNIIESVSDHETYLRLHHLYKDGKLLYQELKEQLIEDVISFLRPVQKSYHQMRRDELNLTKILSQGAEKVRPIAQKKIEEIEKTIGLLGINSKN